MEHFAGLDVGTKASSLCVVDSDGEIVVEADIPTDPDLLAKALRPWWRTLCALEPHRLALLSSIVITFYPQGFHGAGASDLHRDDQVERAE